MRRTVSFLAVVLLVVPLLGSDAARNYGGATEAVGVEGTWEVISVCRDGEQWGLPSGPWVQINRGGKWTFRQGDKLSMEGDYTTDTSRTPPTFDETTTRGAEEGHTRKFIYRLEGDKLLTAARLGGHEYPKSFHEDGLHIVTWKRLK
jgi:uncharacterized protein (TIGR03067 family)